MMYVSLRYVVPGWIEIQTNLAIKQLMLDPETVDQAKMLNNVLESGNMPSPIYTSISSIWLVAFTGSMWGMIFALILTRIPRFTRLRVQYVENKLKNES